MAMVFIPVYWMKKEIISLTTLLIQLRQENTTLLILLLKKPLMFLRQKIQLKNTKQEVGIYLRLKIMKEPIYTAVYLNQSILIQQKNTQF